jgi:periplasmic protein TonB
MAPEKPYIEPLDEIVFRDRNKDYGAYVLRKKYRKYVTISLFIALFLIIAAAAYPVITTYLNKSRIVFENKDVSAEMMAKPLEEAPPPPPPPPPPENIEQKVKFTAPIVTTDTVEENLVSQDDLTAKPSNEAPPTEEEFAPKEEKKQVIEQEVKPEPFTVVEEMPGFPGGDAEMYKFITTTIKYPEEAKELGIQGKVFVNFVVEPDGSISDVRLIRGIGGGCDEEAIRVIKAMPKWIPGKQRGVPVRVYFNLPIKFTLQ